MIDPNSPNGMPAQVMIKSITTNEKDLYEMRVPFLVQALSEDALYQLYYELMRLGKLLGWEEV